MSEWYSKIPVIGRILEAGTDSSHSSVPNSDNIVNQAKQDALRVDFPELDRFDFIDYGSFSKFRELSSNRRLQYDAYDEMTRDIIISSALSMYSEDATQYDTLGRIMWVESEDTELAKFLNDLIDILDIPKKLHSIYYALAEYGEVYIRLFKKNKDDINPDTGETNELTTESLVENLIDTSVDYEDYVEIVDNPEDTFDLLKNGKTCQYAITNHEAGINKVDRIELYPPDQFVHICLENTHIRDKEVFEFRTIDKDTHIERLHRYKVRRGKSMLHDIYAVEKEIQLLESALLLNRVSKSTMTRMISVEVGDMPKPEVRKLLRRVKSALESKLSVNRVTERSGSIKSYNSPGGLDNIVVNPVRNGKGTINAQQIGGDFDPKSIIDMDYFNNKRFGGLRIPKAFLGFDDTLGSNAGGSLTKLDSRYGRTIKTLQLCVINGITDLLNLYLLHRGMLDKINEFKVRVVSPTTVEDSDRDEMILNRLNVIQQFMATLENQPVTYKKELLEYLLVKYSGDPGINNIIAEHKNDPPPKQEAPGGLGF